MKKENSKFKSIVKIVIVALVARVLLEFLFGYAITNYSINELIPVIFRIILTISAIITWIGIVTRSEHSNSQVQWLIIIAVEPFIGMALFLTFGRSFRNSRRYKLRPNSYPKTYLDHEEETNFNDEKYVSLEPELLSVLKEIYTSTNHHPYMGNSQTQVLTNGEEKFPVLIEKLESATHFILMEYFIIKTDEIGKRILNILKDKASQGLDVYLIYDSIGSVGVNKKFLKSLREKNVRIVANDSITFAFLNTKVNYRNHRKITIIDGKFGFVGGMNLGDEYNNTITEYGHWRDTHLIIEGAAVKSLTQVFFRDWYYCTNNYIKDDKYFPITTVDSSGFVTIVPSGPEYKDPPIRNMLIKMIFTAKNSIKMMTPYLVLDNELRTALVIAANSGVKIDIIIPGIPDKKSIYTVSKINAYDLMEEGINVYTYTKGFTHAKIVIIDDMLASCGTYNLDNRSARINFEVTALLYLQGVPKLVIDFDNDILVSKKLLMEEKQKENPVKRIIDGLIYLLSPLV